MEELQKELADLERKGTFRNTIDDVQKIIESLEAARDSITSNPDSAALALVKLKTPMKTQWDQVNTDLKKVYSALNSYQKVLNKKFKPQDLSVAENEAVSSETFLVNRAIAMHLLREGQFSVATTFIQEANASQSLNHHSNLSTNANSIDPPNPDTEMQTDEDQPTTSSLSTPSTQTSSDWEIKSEALQKEFTDMYNVLSEMRDNKNLEPAVTWSRKHSKALEARGSNLEFELCRLMYISKFTGAQHAQGSGSITGPLDAWAYARSEFGPFQRRYAQEIQQLVGALAFAPNIADSPYSHLFTNDKGWDEVSTLFTKEFCSLLGLSADSPLYVATTAGAIALPSLLKVKTIMKSARTEWTTSAELPVEIPLPPAYHFHSIFVCPVSKEQATDTNPPMMLQCRHVICKESLERVSKGARFKCPYCPGESHPRDARKVYL